MPASESLAAFLQRPLVRRVRARLRQYVLLTRLDRPIGTYLLLWPTLWALWFAAQGVPDLYVLLVFVLGTFCMRAAGCAINDFADRGIDAHVWRTTGRPLATGAIRPREAVVVAAVLALAAFALVLTLNRLTIQLAFGGLALAAVYPFMKRYTHLPQVVLGAAFSWGIPMAFAAQTGTVPPLAWLVFTVNVIWTVGYDTMYAMADKPDDLEIGVKSTAILFGEHDRHMVGLFQLLTLVGLLLIGSRAELGWTWFAAVAAAAALFGYQQFLIFDRQPQLCFRAFLNNAWVGLVLFLGLVAHYALAGG
ncbi:MAG: 4-hydroxybenzoate octaprenyltransferase [Halofilum sp. (in: g-proteobacteria)]|nr:4-hydroxybenzoate octaprenyltransferase [Halofilum sp. (in: g-proteobacteria)]